MRVIFVRHGHRRSGEPDPALTSVGRRQAREAALWLAARSYVPRLLVHTDTARTRQTAEELFLVFPDAMLRRLGASPEDAESWRRLVASFDGADPVAVVGHHPTMQLLLANYGPPPVPVPRNAFASALVLDSDRPGWWRIEAAWPGSSA